MSEVIEIFMPIKCQTASRPRVGRFGAYYSKNYENYRKDAHKFFNSISKEYPIDEDALFKVELEFICYKPKSPSNTRCPFGDLDNYIKSPLDAITYAKMIWKDDVQILEVRATKRYQEKDEAYGTKIIITKV